MLINRRWGIPGLRNKPMFGGQGPPGEGKEEAQQDVESAGTPVEMAEVDPTLKTQTQEVATGASFTGSNVAFAVNGNTSQSARMSTYIRPVKPMLESDWRPSDAEILRARSKHLSQQYD